MRSSTSLYIVVSILVVAGLTAAPSAAEAPFGVVELDSLALQRTAPPQSSDPAIARTFFTAETKRSRGAVAKRLSTSSSTTVLNAEYLGQPLDDSVSLDDPFVHVWLYSTTEGRRLKSHEYDYHYGDSKLTVVAPDDSYYLAVHVDRDGGSFEDEIGDFTWGNFVDLPAWNGQTLWFAKRVALTSPVSSYDDYVAGTCADPTAGTEIPSGATTITWEDFPEGWAVDEFVVFSETIACQSGAESYREYPVDPSLRSIDIFIPQLSEVYLGVDVKGAESIYGESIYIGLPTTYYEYRGSDYLGLRARVRSGAASTDPCVDDFSHGVICLVGGRYEATMTWTGFDGTTQPVVFQRSSDQTALAVFQNNPDDITVITKITNGCSFNGRYWVWLGAFTKGGLNLSVRDTQTEQTASYVKNVGELMTTMKDENTFWCE